MPEEIIKNVATNPAIVKDIITITFYTIGILFVLSLVAKFYIKAECNTSSLRIDNLEKKLTEEINMIKEENKKREQELEKIFELLVELKTNIPIMLNEIHSKIIGREDLDNLVTTKILHYKDFSK